MSRSIIFFIFKLTVSAVLIGFLATNFDFGKSAEKLLGADGAGISFAILVLGFLLVNNTARWRVVMLAIQAVLDVRTTFRLLYIGVFLTRRCLLPLAGMPSECTSDGRKVFLWQLL